MNNNGDDDDERPYDEEKEGERSMNNNTNIKTQCSPPRGCSSIQSMGSLDGGEGKAFSNDNNDDEGWILVDTQLKEEEDEEEDAEFAMFVEGLRREVAGDHTEVRVAS